MQVTSPANPSARPLGPLLRGLDGFLDLARRAVLFLTVTMFGLMMAVNTVNIVVRWLFEWSWAWVFPWSGVVFVWMTLLGFFVYFRLNQDVVVDLVARQLPPAARKLCAVAGYAVVVLVSALVISTAMRVFSEQTGLLQMVAIPRYSLAAPVYVSAALIILECVLRIGAVLTGAARPFEDDDTPAAETHRADGPAEYGADYGADYGPERDSPVEVSR